jgi:hypothetical protein
MLILDELNTYDFCFRTYCEVMEYKPKVSE